MINLEHEDIAIYIYHKHVVRESYIALANSDDVIVSWQGTQYHWSIKHQSTEYNNVVHVRTCKFDNSEWNEKNAVHNIANYIKL